MDWQEGFTRLEDSLEHMFRYGFGTDVEIMVNDGHGNTESIHAHRTVLIARSSFLATALQDEYAIDRKQDHPIVLKDISFYDFSPILHFFYTNEHGKINKENIAGVYSAAKRYKFHQIEIKCKELLNMTAAEGRMLQTDTLFDPTNAFELLRVAKKFGDEELIELCWTYIDLETPEVLDCWVMDEDKMLENGEMEELLGRDTIKIKELHLFYFFDWWIDRKCKKAGISIPNNAQKRAEMGKLIHKIRFPLFEPFMFTEEIAKIGILSDEEVNVVLLYFCDQRQDAPDPLPFSAKERAFPIEKPNKLIEKHDVMQRIMQLENELAQLKRSNAELAKD